MNRTSIRSIYGGFNFEGRETVSRIPLIAKSFKMQFSVIDDNRVANYDEHLIMEYWNSTVISQSWDRKMYNRLKHGIVKRTFRIILLYLLGYFTFSLIMLMSVCEQTALDANQNDSSGYYTMRAIQFFYQMDNKTQTINLTDFCTNYDSINDIWRQKEYNMTRILTLLIGFYVGFIVRTWWQQLRQFPNIDKLCMSMGSFVFVNSGIDEGSVGVEINKVWVSIRQFKKDIARLLLLSWAMCLCRISKPLKDVLPRPESFNQKQLLTKKEYNQLKTDTNDDCWLEKWTTPLLWVNQMVCRVNKDTKVVDGNGDVEDGVKFRDPKEIGITLFKFKDQLQSLSNQYYYKIPDLMLQCITLALYFFMSLGVFAGQSLSFHAEDTRPIWEKLLGAFPLYYCVKYILLIGWLKTAKDLQNPFGEVK